MLQNILFSSLSSALLIMVLVVVQRAMIRLSGARWNYYLWAVIFIPWVAIWVPWYEMPTYRLFNVFFIEKMLHNFFEHSFFVGSLSQKIFILLTNGFPNAIAIAKVLLIIWIIGVLLSFSFIFIRHLQFVKLLKNNSWRLPVDICLQLNKNFKKYKSKIYLSTVIETPMLCHIINPKIYLPVTFFDDFNENEQGYILEHELTHLKRHDLWANAVMLVFSCLNWFNPLMFLAYGYFRNAQELSCDALVTQQHDAVEKKAYGYTLLKSALNQTGQMTAMSCGWGAKHQLQERCKMLKFHYSKPKKIFLGFLVLITTAITVMGLTGLENRTSLFFYSMLFAQDANFVLKIFNSTKETKIYYSVISPQQASSEGILYVGDGDDSSKFVTINVPKLAENSQAEVFLKDKQGNIVFHSKIMFDRKTKEFITDTLKLDSHYVIGTNIYGPSHIITFDIQPHNTA
jgi:beta-lactamase regulating signal transducer with metallopeptidase domain